MAPVSVIILHPDPAPGAGPLARALAEARAALAREHEHTFRALGATDVRLVAGPPDELSFGQRLAGLVAGLGRGGLVVLGSGAAPLARPGDLAPFVEAAARHDHVALANNRFSADVVAIARAAELPPIPDLAADNALPRWLAERAGWQVRDLGARWRLQVDLDSPLDLVLTGRTGRERFPVVDEQLEALRPVLADRRAEVVVAGRTSAAALRWLERHAAARIRALVEERGLRAASPLAQGGGGRGGAGGDGRGGPGGAGGDGSGDPRADRPSGRTAPRPPRSTLGLLLEHDGPAALGSLLAQLGEAAIVDSRVLLAHRLGADERAWPSAEDRFASDLLDPSSIADPWLRALTASAVAAPIPVLLGGHTLVGPGVRLVTGSGRRAGTGRIGQD